MNVAKVAVVEKVTSLLATALPDSSSTVARAVVPAAASVVVDALLELLSSSAIEGVVTVEGDVVEVVVVPVDAVVVGTSGLPPPPHETRIDVEMTQAKIFG